MAKVSGQKKVDLTDYLELADQTLGVYGNTHEAGETYGLFDFATFTLDEDFVIVRRAHLEDLCVYLSRLEATNSQLIEFLEVADVRSNQTNAVRQELAAQSRRARRRPRTSDRKKR